MKDLTKKLIDWTREYLNSFGGNTKAIIGISGGKDSTVAAAICVEAVGKDRVIGVLMPNYIQKDMLDSIKVCKTLDIKYHIINIGDAYQALKDKFTSVFGQETNYVFNTNTPARLRMTSLYGVAAMYGDSRVVNTCNRSEDYVGYSTKFGDSAGDFSVFANLCVREVLEIGDDLGLPSELVHKVPSDGMCGKTDEDNLGFTYATLDAYLLDDVKPEEEILNKIERMHKNNLHKLELMPAFKKDVK